jgi:hypothetical protein
MHGDSTKHPINNLLYVLVTWHVGFDRTYLDLFKASTIIFNQSPPLPEAAINHNEFHLLRNRGFFTLRTKMH